jgi:hypothetical protein
VTHLIDEKEAAALLHVSVKSLQVWRVRGGGPRFVKLGRCVRYAMADLDTFVQEALRRSTSDPGPVPGRPGIRVERLLEQTGRARITPSTRPASPQTALDSCEGAYTRPTRTTDEAWPPHEPLKK